MKDRLIMLFIVIVCLLIVTGLSRSIYELWQKGRIVAERQIVKDKLVQQNTNLINELSQVESAEYIEKQARDKLNLQKEGEIVVVLPKKLDTESTQNQPEKELSNWLKWWRLFF